MKRASINISPRATEQWYTPKQAAAQLGCSTETLRRYRLSGKIDGRIHPNGRWVYAASELARFSTPLTYDEYIKTLII